MNREFSMFSKTGILRIVEKCPASALDSPIRTVPELNPEKIKQEGLT